VAVSAVLGLVLGAVAGLALSRRTTSGPDPLALGVSLVNQPCSGKSLLLVGWGDTGSPLARGVAGNPDAHYLDTSASCRTAWPGSPRYVAYLGPYPYAVQACSLRMSDSYRGDVVTLLKEGSPRQLECGCYLDVADMPTLQMGGHASLLDGVWTRSLQMMLTTLGMDTRAHWTGTYDRRTADEVTKFQSERGLPPTGVMNSDTWRSLRAKVCVLYDN
jgi:hypothetical protein